MPSVPPENQPGWFSPQTADNLLATPLRQQLMKIIWQRTSLSSALFAELYQAPVSRFAELVQLLPASEYHHHAHPGGLLDHTLEVMAFAAKLRQRHLLPAGAAPEDQVREAEAWTAGILYAALLHDVGKIATDIRVTTDDDQSWYPWQGALSRSYQLQYHKKRDHQLHPVLGGLMATQILPVTALNWLAQYPELYTSFLYCITGHYDRAGIMGELVQEADRASVAKSMGANANTALQRQQPSLAKQILTALRELVQTQFKLSNPHSGSDGWLTEDALWLISKTTADRIRAWLLQQGVTSVPDSNVRLFDEMQAHGLIIPTPEDKAVWQCDIKADGGWTPGCSLTLLRLSPARIWGSPEQRPAPFAGKVIPVNLEANQQTSSKDATLSVRERGIAELTDLTLSLFAEPDQEVVVAQSDNLSMNNTITTTITESEPVTKISAQKVSLPVQQNNKRPEKSSSTHSISDNDFIVWLREGIRTHKIMVNDTLARVHMVNGKAFLVSPEIFKLYIRATAGSTGDEWKQIQKSFQKLKLHQRGNDGINIFTCEVKGPRKTRHVKGYLLNKPEDIFDNIVPEDNPYLTVIE